MKRILGLTLVIACLAATLVQPADARPQYLKVFNGIYPQVKAVRDVKCSVCHGMKNKKTHNNYGTALDAALGAENVKVDAAIGLALRAVEDKPSAVPGKTFGDLLEEGELPGERID